MGFQTGPQLALRREVRCPRCPPISLISDWQTLTCPPFGLAFQGPSVPSLPPPWPADPWVSGTYISIPPGLFCNRAPFCAMGHRGPCLRAAPAPPRPSGSEVVAGTGPALTPLSSRPLGTRSRQGTEALPGRSLLISHLGGGGGVTAPEGRPITAALYPKGAAQLPRPQPLCTPPSCCGSGLPHPH